MKDCRVPQGSILGRLLFLLYINDMLQAVDWDLFLYADETYLLFQHKDLERIKEELTKNFSNICDWFVDNKLSIHFGEDKTKSILFSTKNRKKENWNSGHTIWWCQNQTILKSNIFRLWGKIWLSKLQIRVIADLNYCTGKTDIKGHI